MRGKHRAGRLAVAVLASVCAVSTLLAGPMADMARADGGATVDPAAWAEFLAEHPELTAGEGAGGAAAACEAVVTCPAGLAIGTFALSYSGTSWLLHWAFGSKGDDRSSDGINVTFPSSPITLTQAPTPGPGTTVGTWDFYLADATTTYNTHQFVVECADGTDAVLAQPRTFSGSISGHDEVDTSTGAGWCSGSAGGISRVYVAAPNSVTSPAPPNSCTFEGDGGGDYFTCNGTFDASHCYKQHQGSWYEPDCMTVADATHVSSIYTVGASGTTVVDWTTGATFSVTDSGIYGNGWPPAPGGSLVPAPTPQSGRWAWWSYDPPKPYTVTPYAECLTSAGTRYRVNGTPVSIGTPTPNQSVDMQVPSCTSATDHLLAGGTSGGRATDPTHDLAAVPVTHPSTSSTTTTTQNPDGSSTSTTTGSNPSGGQTTDPGGEDCMGAIWSWNPWDWVYTPIKCAVVWSWSEASSGITDALDSMRAQINNSAAGALFTDAKDIGDTLVTAYQGANGDGDCHGPALPPIPQVGLVDQSYPLATCDDPTKTWAAWFRPIAACLMILSSVWIGVSLIAHTFNIRMPGETYPEQQLAMF